MKKILVLMSTYNGEKFLNEQIDSILNQKDLKVGLLVRDDGSKDSTTKILDEYKKEGKLDWYTGDNLRPAKSFMDLVKKCGDSDYYAFADQDDFWEENKLIRAVEKLEESNTENGKLYMSTLNVVDVNLELLHKTVLPNEINIKNEMIKNYATGCTMVFDKNLRDYVNSVECDYIPMHDSHICRLAYLNDSYVYVDQESYIKYRQHGNNVLGMSDGFFDVWKTRWNHFVNSECISSKTAEALLNANVKMSLEDRKFLDVLSKCKIDKKSKKELRKYKIFKNDEKTVRRLFKIKLFFNKV